ncbi:hypothetical protein F5Y10DRAFT_287266 [Nemania abortiva]|nr:hypothetical protein F5Y10DRAFT_287266 [Nemania abortiva]
MSGPTMKYTVTHYRKPDHTHEEFIKWIVDVHLPLAIPIFKRHGVLSYSLMRKIQPTWDVADFDCFIEYTIRDMETISKVMSDKEWSTAIKDQEDWVDVKRALVSVGYSTPYLLETGEVVNMAK